MALQQEAEHLPEACQKSLQFYQNGASVITRVLFEL